MVWTHYEGLIWLTAGVLVTQQIVSLLTRIERNLTNIHTLLKRQFPEQQQFPEEALRERITPYIKHHQKIAAIKIVRHTLGCTLIEAKQFVDEWAAKIS